MIHILIMVLMTKSGGFQIQTKQFKSDATCQAVKAQVLAVKNERLHSATCIKDKK